MRVPAMPIAGRLSLHHCRARGRAPREIGGSMKRHRVLVVLASDPEEEHAGVMYFTDGGRPVLVALYEPVKLDINGPEGIFVTSALPITRVTEDGVEPERWCEAVTGGEIWIRPA